MAKALGRGMRAVRGRKRVIDPDVAEFCQLSGEGWIVLFFLFMEAGIFQAQDIAILHCRNGLGRHVADAFPGKRHRLLDHLRQRGRDRLERIFGVTPLGATEMREQDDLAALAGNFRDGRGDALEPRGVADLAVLHGNVEVDAQQHAFALYVDVIEGAE